MMTMLPAWPALGVSSPQVPLYVFQYECEDKVLTMVSPKSTVKWSWRTEGRGWGAEVRINKPS